MMSTRSLPKLFSSVPKENGINGCPKYATIERGTKLCASNGDMVMPPPRRRRFSLQRAGTITKNQFRGVNKSVLEKQTQLLICSMTIDELYEEILFEILHNVGCDVEMDNCQTALFNYIQEAFKISDDDHQRIYDNASVKEAPELRLNIEIVEAKDLKPKDPNGLADPFVTMYLLSTPNHRYNTSVKSESLTPQWEEHFSLPIDDNTANGNLVVEVWDFDPAESVKEKMNKIFDVKGVKGLRKLMKEIAQTASTGKHDNELIGTCNISLRTIPATGINMWYGLSKKTKSKTQGVIHIRLNFSSEKNTKVATSEHKHLLQILLMHELETSKVAPGWWSGKFSAQGETIITQHRIQSGLTSHDCTLAQWFVYTSVHIEHQLSFSLFAALMIKIVRAMSTTVVPEDDVKMIWEGLRKLLPSCFSLIRKLRRKSPTDKNSVKTLSEVLLILQKLRSIKPPEDFNLLPKQTYGWITATEEPNCDLYGALTDAVRSGVEDWFNHINEINSGVSTTSDEEKLQQIIKTIQLIRSDLQRTVELYDRLFQEKVDLPYAQICYDYYDMKLAEFIEPIITTMCKNMKRINLPEGRVSKLPECNDLNMGTALFELYLVLKRFSTLGSAISPLENNFKINSFHNWFTTGVTHWLDISVFKAFNRIEKAIDLDQLIAVDDTVKYSSSAVDTLAIFYQIKIFWEQLDWPDVEGSYMFVGKIVDDICKCCIFYADRMSQKVEGLGDVENVYEKKFEVTNEWCLAINNIDYVRQSLPQFVKELGIDEIINQLSEYRSPMEAERCSDTIKNVVENAIDIEKNKILELIDIVAKKMVPVMRRFLLQGAELIHQDSNSMDRLMNYLEESLTTLHSELNEVNFERVLDSIWTELAVIIYELIQSNLDKRRPPSFFANLRDTLHVLMKYFRDADNLPKAVGDIQVIEHIEKTLKLHALETAELIHHYHLYRLEEQCKLDETKYGQLTVRCSFKGNNLEVEVMNARNLCPADSNGSCDPFVRIALLPEEKFVGVVKPKTNAQSKTLFPLFDEKFTIVMTEEQREIKDAIILFSLKDKDYFGMANQYLAECFLSFDEIESSENNQIHLKLSRPSYSDIECIRALETRQGDKQAKDFLKKLKQKCV